MNRVPAQHEESTAAGPAEPGAPGSGSKRRRFEHFKTIGELTGERDRPPTVAEWLGAVLGGAVLGAVLIGAVYAYFFVILPGAPPKPYALLYTQRRYEATMAGARALGKAEWYRRTTIAAVAGGIAGAGAGLVFGRSGRRKGPADRS